MGVVVAQGYDNWLRNGDWGSIPGLGKNLTPGFVLESSHMMNYLSQDWWLCRLYLNKILLLLIIKRHKIIQTEKTITKN